MKPLVALCLGSSLVFTACSRPDAEPLPSVQHSTFQDAPPPVDPGSKSTLDSLSKDFTAIAVFADALANKTSDLAVSQSGILTKVLADDNDGSRHQKFILKLSNGQTLLFAHNIDIAPRLPSPTIGQTIAFRGIYEWNAQGGVVHWTHRDPSGSHATGWLWANGVFYQ
ncbi:MAG: hypothetical protein RL318_1612 [Fibrobacterota bacterium]|jgi:hypothetical protein